MVESDQRSVCVRLDKEHVKALRLLKGVVMEMEAKLDAILEQLRLTNHLLALLLVADVDTVSKKGVLLLDSGFRPKDVSDMLGVPIGTVTKARSRAKGKTEH